MERTSPSTLSKELLLYLQTIYSLLRSSADVQIRSLEEVHSRMHSSLHLKADSPEPDFSALIYSVLRLPSLIINVDLIILGQTPAVFKNHGYPNIESWQRTVADARRRFCLFDGKDTLACFISSRSDIDDIVPTITAYQIEWNKLHERLQDVPDSLLLNVIPGDFSVLSSIAGEICVDILEFQRLAGVLGNGFSDFLFSVKKNKKRMKLRLLGGSLNEYWRATRSWWDQIEQACPDLLDKPVYFISSNNHSVVNSLTGFAIIHQEELINFLYSMGDKKLVQEWEEILKDNSLSNKNNFLYYLLKKVQSVEEGKYLVELQKNLENELGILRVFREHTFNMETQIIPIKNLDINHMDSRLNIETINNLVSSNAYILNIEYPLGMGAYNILSKIAEYVGDVLGAYIIGKAASLNGVIGDIMIPTVVYDEHSNNTYMYRNAIEAKNVSPYLSYGTVLDNQKAVTVLGTFLQNEKLMDVIYRESYTDIEMESGPYLSAMYEMYRPKRHPINEIVSLHRIPFDIGIVHYASDTPLSEDKNLGAGSLSYFGMDSTYAATVAILNRILQLEEIRR
ncbi:MAG: hypothetical protein JXA19_05820 [Anaerolineales bacterium]|nr:hypothetical protein [Anaerolineales bacterium]